MAERTTGLRAALSNPRIYMGFQRLLAARSSNERFLADHLKPRPGERILDIGCGPARILSYLPEVFYFGIDISPRYVAAARREHGDRGEFHCMDIRESQPPQREFDAVLIKGLIHHFDDADADLLLRIAAHSMRDLGRMVAIENAYVEGQSRIARWIINRDRGVYVRTPQAYAQLAKRYFAVVEYTIREDLMRIPYTHLILECREPRRGGAVD